MIYNTKRPHSALGGCAPAPETFVCPDQPVSAPLRHSILDKQKELQHKNWYESRGKVKSVLKFIEKQGNYCCLVFLFI